jgi:disulfide bond formation protein DsbB
MSSRLLSFLGFSTCALLIGVALYFQHVAELEPCPLCIFQRIAFIATGIIFLLCFLHNPRGIGRRIYGFLATLTAITGAAIAARHVWIQNLPEDQVPECGPGLDFMLEALPFQKMLETVLRGSGECADVQWTLVGLSMPGWSLVWLVLLTLLAINLMLRRK